MSSKDSLIDNEDFIPATFVITVVFHEDNDVERPSGVGSYDNDVDEYGCDNADNDDEEDGDDDDDDC